MIYPPNLKHGDTVGIVSTARKITESELQPFLALLTEWDLKPLLGESIGAEQHQFAGSDDLRTRDFQAMIDNPKVKAIWCARGGYGTIRMLDALDFSLLKEHPKWIIGYSDVTVIHSALNTFGIASLHGQMGLEINKRSEASRQSIHDVLFGNVQEYDISSEASLFRTGIAQGELIGGNLSVLYSVLGSPSANTTEGKILFIEDLDEYLYHIDRMMQNFKRSGMLSGLSGLIVGGMTEMNDNAIPFGQTAEEIIWDSVKEYDYPVCFGFPAGHIEDNRALIMGAKAIVTVSEKNVSLAYNL